MTKRIIYFLFLRNSPKAKLTLNTAISNKGRVGLVPDSAVKYSLDKMSVLMPRRKVATNAIEAWFFFTSEMAVKIPAIIRAVAVIIIMVSSILWAKLELI